MKTNKGFSIVELIVVIAIMAVLAGVAIPVYQTYIDKTKMANDKKMVSDVLYVIDIAGQSKSYPVEVEQLSGDGMKIPVGMIVFTENGATVIAANDTNKNTLTTIVTENVNELGNLKLQYDGWEASYGSFFASSAAMMQKIDTIGTSTVNYINDMGKINLLAFKTELKDGTIYVKGGLSGKTYTSAKILGGDYKDADDLTYKLAVAISGVDRATFIEKWADLTSEQSEGFGLPNGYREFYASVRAAYNQCVANFIAANAEEHDSLSTHVGHMPNYGEDAGQLIGDKLGSEWGGKVIAEVSGGDDVFFPWAVCKEAFDNHAATSEFSFLDCSLCCDAWEDYCGSEQAKADAEAFYDVMVTGASYNSGNNKNPGAGITDWATEKTADVANIYGQLDGITADSKILVTVYQDSEGFLYTEVNTPGVVEKKED